MMYFVDVSAGSPIGPLAWSFWVLIPISAESEFEAVGESCGRIDVDSCRIHLIQEFLGILVILRDDRLGVTGIVVVDVGDPTESTILQERI